MGLTAVIYCVLSIWIISVLGGYSFLFFRNCLFRFSNFLNLRMEPVLTFSKKKIILCQVLYSYSSLCPTGPFTHNFNSIKLVGHILNFIFKFIGKKKFSNNYKTLISKQKYAITFQRYTTTTKKN